MVSSPLTTDADLLLKNLDFTDREPLGRVPDPFELAERGTKLNFDLLRPLTGHSILSSLQFDKPLIRELCRFAAILESTEIAAFHPLDGLIAITGFFEPSTRTRLSFESAVLRLDGKILSVADGSQTGVAKGESLADVGEMFNAYGDAVIMRHTETAAVAEICRTLRIPLINAGNGTGEHPTQALADWFALLKWRPELAADVVPDERKVHIGIIGTPAQMRAVKSFLLMALQFKQAISRITIISEMADPLGPELHAALQHQEVDYEICNDIQGVISDIDVFYMNSIALLGDSYKTLGSNFRLDAQSPMKSDAVILHPLARREELDVSLDKTNHNLYFSQAAGAVYVRQALLITTLNRFDRLPKKFWE